MNDARDVPVTELLLRWRDGDRAAFDQAITALYGELHRIAMAYFRREARPQTLQPTALIHEAFLRLDRQTRIAWRSRSHFLAIAARLMRQILVDHARGRRRLKRGGDAVTVPLIEAEQLSMDSPRMIVALDEGLCRLAIECPERAMVVELRFFGGMTIEQTAKHLGISERSVSRQWRRARAWLYRELQAEDALAS